MVRLLSAFLLALTGHIYLLQFHIPLAPSAPPELVSDSSVTVTLHNYQKSSEKQPAEPETVKPAIAPEPPLKQPPVQKPPKPPPPEPKLIEPQKITPRAHKIKKSVTPQPPPEQLCEIEPRKKEHTAHPPQSTTQKHNTQETYEKEIIHTTKRAQLPTGEATGRAAAASVVKARPLYQHNPKPEYPAIAQRRGWQGRAVLLVEVRRDGTVASARVLATSGFDILDASALRAVKKWHFLAGTIDGKPLATSVQVPVHFRLTK